MKKIIILIILVISTIPNLCGQTREDFDLIEHLFEINNFTDLRNAIVVVYGNPDESKKIEDAAMEDLYNFTFNLSGNENFNLQLTVYKKDLILRAVLIYPPIYENKVNSFLNKLDFRDGKYYKKDSELFYEAYESTEKASQPFNILMLGNK